MARKSILEHPCYAVERGFPVGPAPSRRAAPADEEARLTTGASMLIVLLSSLGLWGIIWAVVASLA
jgi:hypothetical protein